MKVRETFAQCRKIVESKWSGTVDNAFFDTETFDKCRVLKQPEYSYSAHTSKYGFYILSVDVGRKGWILSCPCKISLIAGISYTNCLI